MRMQVAGLEFQNPIVLAAGTAGYGREVDDVLDLAAIGGIATKAVSVEPRQGAPPLRVSEFAGGMINAIGLANQGESCLAWDARDGQPICPVISWQDDRTASVTAALGRDGAARMVMQRAGLPLDPYFSASKLGWIMRHVPQAAVLAAQGHLRLGTTDAFFRDRLTGRFETDIATASRTSLMGIATGAWDSALSQLFGVPMAALPKIGPTSGTLGTLPGGARLCASIVDQQAALYGHGCRTPGAGCKRV